MTVIFWIEGTQQKEAHSGDSEDEGGRNSRKKQKREMREIETSLSGRMSPSWSVWTDRKVEHVMIYNRSHIP